MFTPYLNSYLQLVCAINPRVINKAVRKAMRSETKRTTLYTSQQRLDSMQPSLYAPMVDATKAQVGFERIGLRLLIRQISSPDSLEQLQAIYSVLDAVYISESAIYLIGLQLVNRLQELILHRDPIVREKICIILSVVSTYHQGRLKIMARPRIIDHLMWMIMRDRREIRFAAANALRVITENRCAAEVVSGRPDLVVDLLKSITSDHHGIVIHHLQTFANLAEWDPELALKANSFQIMLQLFENVDPRIVSSAMDCMTQLCKHPVGQKLADDEDLTKKLRTYLKSTYTEIIISAAGVMMYTTLTTRSKWRAKEFIRDLSKRLIFLCTAYNKPLLQLRAMQILINLCDCPDVRNYMKKTWEARIKSIRIRTHEEWDGTTETSSYGLETGHNYRTMCIEGVETIKNDYGDNADVVNVHSYLQRVRDTKEHLIYAINYKCYLH